MHHYLSIHLPSKIYSSFLCLILIHFVLSFPIIIFITHEINELILNHSYIISTNFLLIYSFHYSLNHLFKYQYQLIFPQFVEGKYFVSSFDDKHSAGCRYYCCVVCHKYFYLFFSENSFIIISGKSQHVLKDKYKKLDTHTTKNIKTNTYMYYTNTT